MIVVCLKLDRYDAWVWLNSELKLIEIKLNGIECWLNWNWIRLLFWIWFELEMIVVLI